MLTITCGLGLGRNQVTPQYPGGPHKEDNTKVILTQVDTSRMYSYITTQFSMFDHMVKIGQMSDNIV